MNDSCFLVTGVAKPESVEATVKGRAPVVGLRHFADHHNYTQVEIDQILDEVANRGARWILSTGKDATKLVHFSGIRERLWVVDVKMKLSGDVRELNEAISRLARPSR